MAMVQGLLDQAAKAYGDGKAAATASGQKAFFCDAARLWESSLCQLPQDNRKVVLQNLAVTYLKLAALAAEAADADQVRYYIIEMKKATALKSQLLGEEEGPWDKISRKLREEVQDISSNFEMRLALLRAFLRAGALPTAEASRSIDLYCSQLLVQKAVVLTEDCDHARPWTAPEQRQTWIMVQRYITEAATHLSTCSDLTHSDEWANPDLCLTLTEQARFLWHRSDAVLKLMTAVENQTCAMLNSDDLDMDLVFETFDSFNIAVQVSQVNGDIPVALGTSVMDVEMTCVNLSCLGKFFEIMGMPQQAERRYKECINLALSMATGTLHAQSWYMQARNFVQATQQERLAEEKKQEDARREAIRPQLQELQKANKGKVQLLVFLFDKYPPNHQTYSLVKEHIHEKMSKKQYMKAMLAYAVDKQHHDRQTGWTLSMDLWRDFCTEAQKYLNHWYEKDYKGQE